MNRVVVRASRASTGRCIQAQRALSTGFRRNPAGLKSAITSFVVAPPLGVGKGYHQTAPILQEHQDVTNQFSSETEAIDYIQSNPLVIVSKSTCPFCSKVKQLLGSIKTPYSLIELDNMGSKCRAALVVENCALEGFVATHAMQTWA
eukprot:gb/GECG01014077.1/.p1 GENE.gb/GECG01014077.1/~~gb/GECG01014077.1/.p1  ORF type:complete len:147 (+),score=4.79 gb/GECG01014077.1/:1-441(+)